MSVNLLTPDSPELLSKPRSRSRKLSMTEFVFIDPPSTRMLPTSEMNNGPPYVVVTSDFDSKPHEEFSALTMQSPFSILTLNEPDNIRTERKIRNQKMLDTLLKMDVKQITVAVMGNIGSGKTELTTAIARRHTANFVAVLEPVEEWQENGILAAFYNNMDKYALPFQLYTFSSRLRSLKKVLISDTRDIIQDGGIFLDKYMFKEGLRDGGKIDDVSNGLYEATFEDWKMLMPDTADPKLIIWVDTPPEVCLQRLKQRSRSEEVAVTIGYLQSLQTRLHGMMNILKEQGYKIVWVDGKENPDDVADAAISHILEVQRESSDMVSMKKQLDNLGSSLDDFGRALFRK